MRLCRHGSMYVRRQNIPGLYSYDEHINTIFPLYMHFTDFVSHDHKTHVILSSGSQTLFRRTTNKIKAGPCNTTNQGKISIDYTPCLEIFSVTNYI